MRKSATSLSLILMSTLIMLVPFTSINFPNVKAQEYGAYDEEMYSDYPSKVNKYECQKGPFEGFFVSSVEFCLLKTNQALEKDNDRIKDKDSDRIKDKDSDRIEDNDNDSVENNIDNCPAVFNTDQTDSDNDGIGDVCDPSPKGPEGSEPIYLVWSDISGEILISFSTDGGQTFSTPKIISNTNSNSLNPDIIVSGTTVHVVWQELIGTEHDIFITTSTDGGQTFSTPRNISNTAANSGDISIAISGNKVYIVWTEGNDLASSEIFLTTSTDGGQTFSTPRNISNTSEGSSNQEIAVSGNNVHVVWIERALSPTSDALITTSTDGGQTFSTPHNISNQLPRQAADPSIAASGNNIYIALVSQVNLFDDIFIITSTDGGQTFSTPRNISNTATASAFPNIVVTGTTVHVVWVDAGGIFITTSTDGGQTFSTPKPITTNNGFNDYDIIVSESTIHIVWVLRQTQAEPQTFISTSTDGGNIFSTPKLIDIIDGDRIFSSIQIGINSPQTTTPPKLTREVWVNPNFNSQASIDVQKVTLICEGENCANSINTPQKTVKTIVVQGKDPFSAYCSDPVTSPCEYTAMEGPSIGQHSNKLFGSLLNTGTPSDRETNFYLITLQFDGTNLFFTADNRVECTFNLSSCAQFFGTGANQPLVLESRTQS